MNNNLNKTALISGASSGIGAEVAIKFSNEGYDLILLGRDLQKLENTKKLCSTKSKIKLLAFDLKNIENYKNEITSTISELSPIEVLVNNAGIYTRDQITTTTSAIWFEQFQVNLLSSVLLTQIIWPFFVKNNKGSIVNISSTLGLKPSAQTQAYSAIKAALNNWTLSLAQEGGPHNIRVNCICPGIVDTPIHSFHHLDSEQKNKITQSLAELQLLNKIGQTQDIANATYFLASDNSKWTTGSILSVDGGINIK